MYKLFIFDLDGVLVDSQEMHQQSLVASIKIFAPNYEITNDGYKIIQMAIPSKEKLKRLGIEDSLFDSILKKKQEITMSEVALVKEDPKLVKLFKRVARKSKIAVASNSHSETVQAMLDSLGLIDLVDFYIGNDEINKTKPNPEIYIKTMSFFNISSKETVIFEDSPVGIIAAQLSGGHVVRVKNSKDLKKRLRRILVHR